MIEKFYGSAIGKLNDTTLVTARDNCIEIWRQEGQYESPYLIDAFDAGKYITALAALPNMVVVGTEYGYIFVLPVIDGRIAKENARIFQAFRDDEIKSMVISDCGLIAAVWEYNGLTLWDASLSMLAHVPGAKAFESVGFSADGMSVIFGGDDGLFTMPLSSLTPIQITSNWTRLNTFTSEGHIVASQTGKTLVLDSTDYSVLLETSGSYTHIAISGDDKVIAIKRNKLIVFNSLQDFAAGRPSWHDSTVLRANRDVPTGIVVSKFKINVSFI
jgi:hypothetical protein